MRPSYLTCAGEQGELHGPGGAAQGARAGPGRAGIQGRQPAGDPPGDWVSLPRAAPMTQQALAGRIVPLTCKEQHRALKYALLLTRA